MRKLSKQANAWGQHVYWVVLEEEGEPKHDVIEAFVALGYYREEAPLSE